MNPTSQEPAPKPLQVVLRQRRLRRRAEMKRLDPKIVNEVEPDRDPLDREFLPSALALLETPAPPQAAYLLYVICALVATALLWSWFGHLDVYANASGKIQPIGKTKIIQPLATGKVTKIAVKDGDIVKAGDVLVELDPADAIAMQNVAANKLMNAEAELVRRNGAIAALTDAGVDVDVKLNWSEKIPPQVRKREEMALRAALTNLSAVLTGLQAQKQQKISERDRYSKNLESQQAVIEVISDQVGMVRTLNEKGWNSRADLLTKLLTQRQAELTLVGLKGSLSEAEAAIPVIDSDIRKTRENFLETNTNRLVELSRELEDDKQELSKATARLELMTLTAPISGTIASSTITTVGQVVTTGQQLMLLVPNDATLEIEAYVLNSDIGFVRIGQEAAINVEAFPFTRYGTVNGKVTHIAKDAIPGAEAARQQKNSSQALPSSGLLASTSAAQQTQDLVFPITVAMEKSEMNVDGKAVRLAPGMSVSLQIKTESRRAIDYVISPLRAALSSAAHER